MEGYIKFTVSEVNPETTRIETDCELRHVNMENKGQLISSLMEALHIDDSEMMAHVLAIKLGVLERASDPATDATELPAESDLELSSFAVGDTVKIGDHEMVVLEQFGKETALIRKDLLPDTQFGKSNNYAGSYVDEACQKFAQKLMVAVGEDNVVLHEVDLTSDDGLKDYGTVDRYASLLTTEQYRKYVAVLDQHKPDDWWWLSTPYSTPTHDDSSWVKCVSPSGYIDSSGCGNFVNGVRPFCILKSNIFVSK